jgi:putative ABC transport system permease protein
MKYFPLVWAGLWRKRTRTIFTLASIVVAFLLFGMLQGVNSAFSEATKGANLNRLYVQSKFSFIEPLPFAHKAQIEAVPGVTVVTFANWFGGYYQDLKNQVVSYAVDIPSYLKLYSEYKLPPDQIEAMERTRDGALIGRKLAEKYGWKIGDKIPITSAIWVKKSDGTSNWTFDVVGIFDIPDDNFRTQTMLINFDYFDEERRVGTKGTVGYYAIGIDDPAKAAQIGASIDALFANSANETKTQTEKENMQSFMKQIGDINFIVSSIIGAVFFTLLFLTGNTMMQSVRERIPELAVLKTIGFSDTGVAALVIAEGVLLCLVAAGLGLFGATLVFPMMKSVLGIKGLPIDVVILGLGIAIALACITALAPALQARRLSIVDALSRR